MKNVILILTMLLLSTNVFAGLFSSDEEKSKVPTVEVDEKTGIVTITSSRVFINKDAPKQVYSIKQVLLRASEYSLEKGKKHFIVLNKGINNFDGMPLTKWNDIIAYCTSGAARKGGFYNSSSYQKCEGIPLNTSKEIFLKILPIDENVSQEIFSWDVNKTIEDVK